MVSHLFDLPIRVLLYKEDGEYVAHALEMDLLGYGTTEKSAMQALTDAILSQITFACQQQKKEMLSFPAEKKIFERWEKAHQAQLHGLLCEDQSAAMKTRAAVISVTKQELSEARKAKHKFSRTEELEYA
jgi:hypothetical protein